MINTHTHTSKHIIVKPLKTNDKEKILRRNQKEKNNHISPTTSPSLSYTINFSLSVHRINIQSFLNIILSYLYLFSVTPSLHSPSLKGITFQDDNNDDDDSSGKDVTMAMPMMVMMWWW